MSSSFSGLRALVPWALALCFPFLPPNFFFAPLLSLAFSGFRPWVPWALALCVVCFVGCPLLGFSCALAAFVFSARQLAAPGWLLPPPALVSLRFLRCRSVPPPFFFSSAAFLLPACLALVGGSRRSLPPPPLLFVCWSLLLGSPFAFSAFVFPAWPLAAPWWFRPPPPLCVAVFVVVARSPPFFFLPCFALALLLGARRRFSPSAPPSPSSCFFLFSRCSAPCALSVLLCFPPGHLLLPCGCCPPPPPSVSRGFRSCRSMLRFFFCCFAPACLSWHSSAVLTVRCPPPPPGAWCLALLCCGLLCAVRRLLGRLFVCCAALLVAAAFCAVSVVVPSGWVVLGVVCCFGLRCRVLCCACVPGCGAAPRCCALCRPVLRFCVLCRFVALVWCRCLLFRALWRCPSPWGPALCGAAFCSVPPRCVRCAVCVLSWRVGACCCSPLYFGLCVCLGVGCAFPVLFALCGAVLRCAGALALCCACGACCCWRLVLWCAAVCCAVSFGVLWCGAGTGGPWLFAGGVFRRRCPCLAEWSASLWLVRLAVVLRFPASCSVLRCCPVVLCCRTLLSFYDAVCACFALLCPVLRRCAVLCCAVGCLSFFWPGGGVWLLWCPFPPCQHAEKKIDYCPVLPRARLCVGCSRQ